MQLNEILTKEQKKLQRRTPTAHEKHQFYYVKEFILFCLKNGVSDTSQIDNKIYSNYVRYLKHTKNNSADTRLDKCYAVRNLLEEYGCSFKPNPWRSYAKYARHN